MTKIEKAQKSKNTKQDKAVSGKRKKRSRDDDSDSSHGDNGGDHSYQSASGTDGDSDTTPRVSRVSKKVRNVADPPVSTQGLNHTRTLSSPQNTKPSTKPPPDPAAPAAAGRPAGRPAAVANGGTLTTALAAASKRGRADALLAQLTAKLEATKDPAKRLGLQTKMLTILPKCTSPQPAPPKPLEAAAATVLVGPKPHSGAGGSVAGSGSAPSFVFKLQRTPKTAPAVVAPPAGGPEEVARRRLRQQRFGGLGEEEEGKPDAVLAEAGGLGTSEALEKEYLRLTSLPRAADVRPPAVLAAALRLVKAKWLQRPDYAAAAEQLKAIRQDLTVQHVRDALTVDVYETHGRLALEADDLAEFRRCHGVLRQLYGDGIPGNPAEFEAYGLLYTQATAAARNTLALELGRVPQPLLNHPYVRHAMDVCAAARSGNYAHFVALYEEAPRMSPYIMDRLLGQMRLWALQSTVTAHKPLPVPLEHLAALLGLEAEQEAGSYAEQLGAVVDWSAGCLDTKASAIKTLGPSRPSA